MKAATGFIKWYELKSNAVLCNVFVASREHTHTSSTCRTPHTDTHRHSSRQRAREPGMLLGQAGSASVRLCWRRLKGWFAKTVQSILPRVCREKTARFILVSILTRPREYAPSPNRAHGSELHLPRVAERHRKCGSEYSDSTFQASGTVTLPSAVSCRRYPVNPNNDS